ncbi:MAG: ROK family protein [Caldilineae bacterium]|nr:MAG: ROK family protein [Caldilineae bacterium]
MNDNLLLALDFGGTKLSAAITRAGQTTWLAHRRRFTPPTADGPYEYRTMLQLAHDLIAEAGPPAAIGVSFGGPVDAARGLVRLSHHVPKWENTPLRDNLRAAFGVPVAVDNDANVAALGELRFGAGQGCQTLLYVTVSTGVGGGWIVDGKIYRGADGMAGEIGHTVVNPGGMPCVCGKQGCVEAEACGPAMARRARRRMETDPDGMRNLLRRTGQTPDTLTAEHISRAAAQGDPFARHLIHHAARMLGRGLGTAINLMNPQRVILGGGVTKAGPAWWQTVRETARRHALPEISVDIVPAALGDDAPLWGAIALAQALL